MLRLVAWSLLVLLGVWALFDGRWLLFAFLLLGALAAQRHNGA